jgi:hypothetical protein
MGFQNPFDDSLVDGVDARAPLAPFWRTLKAAVFLFLQLYAHLPMQETHSLFVLLDFFVLELNLGFLVDVLQLRLLNEVQICADGLHEALDAVLERSPGLLDYRVGPLELSFQNPVDLLQVQLSLVQVHKQKVVQDYQPLQVPRVLAIRALGLSQLLQRFQFFLKLSIDPAEVDPLVDHVRELRQIRVLLAADNLAAFLELLLDLGLFLRVLFFSQLELLSVREDCVADETRGQIALFELAVRLGVQIVKQKLYWR